MIRDIFGRSSQIVNQFLYLKHHTTLFSRTLTYSIFTGTNSRLLGKFERTHSTIIQPNKEVNSDERMSDLGNKVFVQCNPQKDLMNISFNFSYGGKSKQFNLSRKGSESLSTSLDRIKLNLVKMAKPKKVKKGQQADESGPEINISLIINDSPVDASKKNIDAWVDEAVMTIDGIPYEVTTNSPQVESIKLPDCIMKDFVTMASVTLVNCSIDRCKVEWYRQISAREKEEIISKESQQTQITFDGSHFYFKLSEGLVYNPTLEDLGHHLKFVCKPCDGKKIGPEASYISSRPVELGPIKCPFEDRHKLTTERMVGSHQFRFVTYNILADLYADSDYSRTVLFGHCPSHALDIDYRRQLLLKEMFGYNADIYCLQEVDRKEFNRTLEPFFKVINNCSGLFDTKGGQVAEGEAIFFKNDKFSLVESHKTLLSELIDDEKNSLRDSGENQNHEDDSTQFETKDRREDHIILKNRHAAEARGCLERFDEIRKAILGKEQLKRRFCDRHTIVQTTLLKLKESTQNEYVMIANTHLYFAPDADHVRLLQGSVCVKYIEYMKEYYQRMLCQDDKNQGEPRISVIFCGDMNSTPDCGLFALLTSGRVGSELTDWSSSGDEELVSGLNVSTHLRFSSAYKDIEYTNFTPEFHGCLDYIYYERDNIKCERTVPLPNHSDVTAIGGLPSDVFPSDHLALIADMSIMPR